MASAAFALPGTHVVGYDFDHPIYSATFEGSPPEGVRMYRRTHLHALRILDALAWRRIKLLHHDASQRLPATARPVPIVVSSEGRPPEYLYRDPRVRQVTVHSEWAGCEDIARGRALLLRPTCPPPPATIRRSRADGDPLVLLAVGIGGMVKGLDVVHRVYEAVRNQFDVRLIVAGTLGHNAEWYPEISADAIARANFPAIEAAWRTDRNVIFGRFERGDLLQLIYPLADVYLHLSRMDTYGFSVLEAMSFGLPVVATGFNALSEMVRDGENGVLVWHGGLDSVSSPEWTERVTAEAAAAVSELLADARLRACMGEASRQRLDRKFSHRHLRSVLATLYRDAGGRDGAP